MVWQARKPIAGYARTLPETSDAFDGPRLGPQWEWNHQPRVERWSLTERPGWLRLRAFRPLARGNLLRAGNTLTQRLMGTAGGEAGISLDVGGMADGQSAGLCHLSRSYAWLGVSQLNGIRRIVYCHNGARTEGPPIRTSVVFLKSLLSSAGETTWAYSLDGAAFTPFGGRYRLEWGYYRGDRLGIFSYNDEADAGFVDVDSFRYEFPQGGRTQAR
jgi:beta-xylosidase